MDPLSDRVTHGNGQNTREKCLHSFGHPDISNGQIIGEATEIESWTCAWEHALIRQLDTPQSAASAHGTTAPKRSRCG